jgi:hypothetical protein
MTIFGPDRASVAVLAINELNAARAAIRNAGWVASDDVYRRLSEAQIARDAYAEYGDTFRGH